MSGEEQVTSLLNYIHNNLPRDTHYVLESTGDKVVLKLNSIPLKDYNYISEHSYCRNSSAFYLDAGEGIMVRCVFILDIQAEVFTEEGVV